LQGDREAARRFLEPGLARARELGEMNLIAWTLHQLGHLSRDRGELAEARAQYEASLRIWRERGDARGIAITLLALGRLALIEGRVDEGLALLQDSLWRYRALGDLTDLTRVLLLLGGAASDLGRVDEARAWFTEGLEIAARLRDHGRVAANLEGCALLAAAVGQPKRALRLAAMAAAIAESSGTVLAITLDEQRRVEARLGPIRRAFGEARWAQIVEQFRGTTIGEAIAYALDTGSDAPGGPSSAADAAGVEGGLTPRDREVVALVARGLTNAQIAEALVISPRTAEWRVARLRTRLGLASRTQVAIWAIQHGLAPATEA
jgi:non-specific serine/threonine protein kinase